MVEIRFKGNYDIVELDGHSVAEIRQQYKAKFDIPDKASVKVNDKTIKPAQEAEIKLSDNDRVRFAEVRSGKSAFMIGAILLALAITGTVFAQGYVTQSMAFNVSTAGGDFAAISVNGTSIPGWTAWGLYKGSTGSGNLFDVNTKATNYTGDLTLTVSIANADKLVHAYRFLGMVIKCVYSNNSSSADINSDNVINSQDFALLTLENGAVNLYLKQLSGAANYTVRLDSGFFVSNIWGSGGWGGNEDPVLYCEVAQR